MSKPVAECKACGKTITAEEVTVGMSLICPRCEQPMKEQSCCCVGSSAGWASASTPGASTMTSETKRKSR